MTYKIRVKQISGSFASASYAESSSYATTASYALNVDTGSLVTTASFNLFTSSYYQDSSSFSSSISSLTDQTSSYVLASQTSSMVVASSSFSETSSYAISSSFSETSSYAISASYALSSSISDYALTSVSSSHSLNSDSSSFSITASYAVSSSLSETSSYYNESDPIFTSVSGTFVLTSSFEIFTGSYNTGSFTGSFKGDGSQLTGIVGSKWTGSGVISREGDVEVSGTLKVDNSSAASFTGAYGFVYTPIIGYSGSQQYATFDPITNAFNWVGNASNDQITPSAVTDGWNSDDGQFFIEMYLVGTPEPIDAAGSFGSPTPNLTFIYSGPELPSSRFFIRVYRGNGTNFPYIDIQTYPGARPVTLFVSGSILATSDIIGNLYGTASWAESSSHSNTASYANTSISSSYSRTSSYAPGYLPLTGGTINGNVTLNGTASIAFLHVTYESASVIYSSGSNQFGDDISDTQSLIGTTKISGSLEVTGSASIPNLTGSLFGTASWAESSSQAISASYVYQAVSASYVTTSQTASYVTASNVNGPYGSNSVISSSQAVSASHAPTANDVIIASQTASMLAPYLQIASTSSMLAEYILASQTSSMTVASSSYASTASYVLQAVSASYAISSSYSVSSSYASSSTSSSYAITASYAMNGGAGATFPYTGSAIISGSLQYIDGNQASSKILTTDSNGNATWQYPAAVGALAYFFSTASSDITGYSQSLVSPQTGSIQTISATGVTSGQLLASFITPVNFPGVAYYPAGTVDLHIHAANTNSGKQTQLYFTISKRDTLGNEIILGNSSYTDVIGGAAAGYVTDLSIPITTASISDRIVTKIYAYVTGPGTSPNISLYLADNTLSRIQVPAAVVNTTNYVPYSGATQNVNLDGFAISASLFTGSFVGNLTGTASRATNSDTASFVTTAQTASYVLQAVTASYVQTAQTASYVLQAISSSYSISSSQAETASFVITAQTASYVQTAQTASYVLQAVTASYVQTAQTASYVTASNVNGPFGSNSILSASFAVSASWAPGGTGAGFPFTGSAIITGSLLVTGSIISTSGFTGSLQGTASFLDLTVNKSGSLIAVNGGTGQSSYTVGDILYANSSTTLAKLPIGGANTVLHGGPSAPAYSAVVEADISLSDNTTNDATTSKHGFLRKLSGNSAQYLDGNGNFSTPTGTVNSYGATTFLNQTSVNVIHNYNVYPVVQVYDNTGAMLIPVSIVNNTVNDFTITFLNSTSGTIVYSVGAPQPNAYKAVTGTYSILTTDFCVEATTGTFTMTLPTAVGNTGRVFKLKNTGTGTVTIACTGGQTIDGETTQYITQYEGFSVMSNGSNYIVIN